jgi:hypothetical protein
MHLQLLLRCLASSESSMSFLEFDSYDFLFVLYFKNFDFWRKCIFSLLEFIIVLRRPLPLLFVPAPLDIIEVGSQSVHTCNFAVGNSVKWNSRVGIHTSKLWLFRFPNSHFNNLAPSSSSIASSMNASSETPSISISSLPYVNYLPWSQILRKQDTPDEDGSISGWGSL